MNRMRYFLPLAVLGIPGACTKPADPATPPMSAAEMTAMPAADPEVRLAADITLAIRAHPGKTDSLLAAYQVTPDIFEQMMYHVAADSTKSAAFKHLTQ